MNQNPLNNLGKQIGDTVRSALESGDLSKLSGIGTAVQSTVQEITASQQENKDDKNVTSQQTQTTIKQTKISHQSQNIQYSSSSAPYAQPGVNRPAWMGSGKIVPKGAPSNFTGVPALVLGSVGATVFGISALAVGVLALVGAFAGSGFLAGALAGAGVISILIAANGGRRKKFAKRIHKYYEMLVPKGVCRFEDLGLAVNQTPEAVKKDAQKALRKNMMPLVYMDNAETCLIYGQENYQLYLESEKSRLKREQEEAEYAHRMGDPELAAMEQFKQQGIKTLKTMQVVRADITDPSVAAEIEGIELTVAKIFDYVQKHPQKLPETRKFMDYYLPITLKVLEKYRQYTKMEVKVPSVVKAQNEIEQTLGTVDTAFQNLLESLYHEETLDVSTDMDVLQTMFRQEGLTGENFHMEAEESAQSDTPDVPPGQPELKL